MKTHCKHGHEYTPENTIYRNDSGRRCRECKRAEGKRYYNKTIGGPQNRRVGKKDTLIQTQQKRIEELEANLDALAQYVWENVSFDSELLDIMDGVQALTKNKGE